MRLIDDDTAAALDGSRPVDEITVWAWRDGELVLPEPLQVLDWSAQDAAGDNVKVAQQLTLTVADPDGTLGAWRLDDPLGVAGTRLQVIYRVGSAAAVNFGWFRVTGNEPDERVDWRVINEYGYAEPDAAQGPHKRMVAVVTAVVKLEAVDLPVDVDRDKLEAPESPRAGATVLSEWQRLTAPYFPTLIDDGVTDVAVSRKLIYDGERLEAGQDLLARVSARYRMDGDGVCHVYPRQLTATVWTADPSTCLISTRRSQSIDGLYNCWIVEGKEQAGGKPLRARVTLDSGPLRYGGPHGKSQYKYSSEMITTYSQALSYAYELRQKFVASLAVKLEVECTPRPELQAGDRIQVGYPLAAGHVAYFPGEITSISRGGDPTPGITKLQVQCSYGDVAATLGRTDWAQHIGSTMPPLNWDKMPGTWGTAPNLSWDDLKKDGA